MHMTLSPLRKTWIFDLDGTLVEHNGYKAGRDRILPGVREFLRKIPGDDCIMILTAREHEAAEKTEQFLKEEGIRYTHVPEIAIEELKHLGIIPGIAINPGTAIETIEELLNMVDRVLIMCVVPGHAGREFAPYVGRKIDRLLSMRGRYLFDIYWDGACTREKVLEYAPKGVKGFVLGTSLLFGHNEPYEVILKRLRAEISLRIGEDEKRC